MEFTYQSSIYETDSTFTDKLVYWEKTTSNIRVLESEISIAGHENLIQLRVIPEGSNGSLEQTQDIWYILDKEALTEIAYRNPAIMTPVFPKIAEEGYYRRHYSPYAGFLESRTLNFVMSKKMITNDYTGGRIPADSIQLREDPRIVLQYPVEENNEWTAITQPFTIHRKVIEVIENELTDQSSWTAAIQSWYDPEEIKIEYFDWVDRFDKNGLISRAIKLTGIRTDEFGEEIDRFHTKEKVELIEIKYSGGD